MFKLTKIGLALLLFAAATGASASAEDAPARRAGEPVVAPPGGPPAHFPFKAPSLAKFDQTSTVSTGTLAPGAEGWWEVSGPNDSVFTINTCGTAFPATITAYDVNEKYQHVDAVGSTPDACTSPFGYTYASDGYVLNPGFVSISDPTGKGGSYIVSYSRTELPADTVKPDLQINPPRIKGTEDASSFKVRIYYRATDDRTGPRALSVRCRLDGHPAEHCLGTTVDARVLYRSVPRGRHTFKLVATDEAGNKAELTKAFRLPPPKHG